MSVQPQDAQPEAEGVLNVTFEAEPDNAAPQQVSQEQVPQPQPELPTQTQTQPEPQPEQKPQQQPQQPQFNPSLPPAPPSEWDLLRSQLQESPFDTNLWNKLVDKAEESGDIDKIKTAYESLLEKYPNTVSFSLFLQQDDPS